ncbi:MAG: (deoxy)nucleoside triphosphate pyrophosphohydrolase [Kiritimatiellae bacterium]|nr:(deoxy)nucleoside triphosphate pyrophosphohydrolase [Kiritimatiellia bacterium]
MESSNGIIEVVGAIIKVDGRYLVGQRAAHKSQGGLWEFMGGKIEPGETPEEALARECREELDLEVENERIVDSVVHEYPDKTIRLTLVECTPKAGSVPHPNEHQDIRWATREELESLDFAAADRDLIRRGLI